MWETLALIWGSLIPVFYHFNRRIETMSAELDALIANEANLETVVAQVVADNAAIHAELTAALANADVGAIQAVADKIAAQTAKLSALVTPAAPAA